MCFRPLFLVFVHIAAMPCSGQTMPFGGGAMHVVAGTQLRMVGPLDWQLAPDAQVINDGTIDLGSEAIVSETDGAPITGAGIELSTWPAIGALTNVHPGGLGLTLTSTYADGNLAIERGHLPSFATNGSASIARWYRISTPSPAPDDMSVVMHYDLTELNGIQPGNLSLFEAPALVGTWTALLSTGDEPAQTLAANDQSPWAYLTAFDFNAVMYVEPMDANEGILIWPTLVHDAVYIAMPGTRTVAHLAILDATGRQVLERTPRSAPGIVCIDLSSLASGTYLLRVNGKAAVQRLIKP